MPDNSLSTNIEQRQTQEQHLTHQQLTMLRLLECTDQTLEQRVTQEIERNPAFDAEAYTAGSDNGVDNADENNMQSADSEFDAFDDDSISENENYSEDNPEEREPKTLSSDEIEDVMQGDDGYYEDMDNIHVSNYSGDSLTPQYEAELSVCDALKDQLHFRGLSAAQMRLCEYLVDCLDDNGFLTRSSYDIIDDYFNVYGLTLKLSEVQSAINVIRTLEPIGVGAADTQDCLLIQLSALPQSEDIILATSLIRDCYKQLSSQSFDSIKARLNISDNQLRQVLSVLNNLNPKPLLSLQDSSLSSKTSVIPEFIVNDYDGKLSVSLTGAKLPPLKLSDEFVRMSSDGDSKTRNFAKQCIDQANEFIAALEMRQQTMMKIMLAIVNRQRDFFLTGDDTSLVPMVLQDIATDTGLEQSTVSRVTSNKYVQTQFGVRLLKSLFTVSAKSNDGESVSRNKVISILRELIDAEDKSAPLSDDQLSELLFKKGYDVKRRTISKYRGELGIGTAQMRKILK